MVLVIVFTIIQFRFVERKVAINNRTAARSGYLQPLFVLAGDAVILFPLYVALVGQRWTRIRCFSFRCACCPADTYGKICVTYGGRA